MRAYAILAALLMGLTSCAQRNDHVVTVAGQSYVMFHRMQQACVHQGVLKELTDHGWTVKSTSESQIVAQQRAPAWINTSVLLVGFEPPQVRLTLTIEPSGSDVKVLIEPGAITNPGSRNERVEPIAATAQMTTVFDNSARRIEQTCGA